MEPTQSPFVSGALYPDKPIHEPIKSMNPTPSPLVEVAEILFPEKSHAPSQYPSVKPISTPPSSNSTAVYLAPEDAVYVDTNQHALGFMLAPAIPMEIIAVLVMFILFISLLYHFNRNHKYPVTKRIASALKIPVLLTFISNMFAAICILTISTMLWMVFTDEITWNSATYARGLYVYYALTVFYSLGKFFLSTFFILRVFRTFKESEYLKISKTKLIMLITWTVINNIAWIAMINDSFLSDFIGYYGYFIVAVMDILLICTLLYLFTNRLMKLLLLSHMTSMPVNVQTAQESSNGSSSTVTPTSADSTSKKEMHRVSRISQIKIVQDNWTTKQRKWMFLITRCIILSTFAMVTTMIFSLVIFYFEAFGSYLFVVYVLWTMDMLINCVCLYLNFGFSTNLYKKCCSGCHGFCQNMLGFCTANKVLPQGSQ